MYSTLNVMERGYTFIKNLKIGLLYFRVKIERQLKEDCESLKFNFRSKPGIDTLERTTVRIWPKGKAQKSCHGQFLPVWFNNNFRTRGKIKLHESYFRFNATSFSYRNCLWAFQQGKKNVLSSMGIPFFSNISAIFFLYLFLLGKEDCEIFL